VGINVKIRYEVGMHSSDMEVAQKGEKQGGKTSATRGCYDTPTAGGVSADAEVPLGRGGKGFSW